MLEINVKLLWGAQLVLHQVWRRREGERPSNGKFREVQSFDEAAREVALTAFWYGEGTLDSL